MTLTTPMRSAMVFGASGLVGGFCLASLLDDETYDRVIVVVRRSLGRAHPKLVEVIADFARLEDVEPLACDDAFVCLGTTIKTAGSQEAFRRVDHDAVVAAAKLAARSGARRLALVSSVGAAPDANSFYLRVKGEAERDVASAATFESLHVFRPSLLLGDRTELRSGERIAQVVGAPLAPLLAGPLARYRPIAADLLAFAMIAAVKTSRPGVFVYELGEITALARTLPAASAAVERYGRASRRLATTMCAAVVAVASVVWLLRRR